MPRLQTYCTFTSWTSVQVKEHKVCGNKVSLRVLKKCLWDIVCSGTRDTFLDLGGFWDAVWSEAGCCVDETSTGDTLQHPKATPRRSDETCLMWSWHPRAAAGGVFRTWTADGGVFFPQGASHNPGWEGLDTPVGVMYCSQRVNAAKSMFNSTRTKRGHSIRKIHLLKCSVAPSSCALCLEEKNIPQYIKNSLTLHSHTIQLH